MRYTTLIEGQDVPVEVPSKYITEVVDLEMRCKVFFVDLEGVHDGRATKNIIPHINPRRMVRYILKPWFFHSPILDRGSSNRRSNRIPLAELRDDQSYDH